MAEMTLEEALAAAEVDNAPVNDIITIDPETRAINLPSSEMLFGVEQDKDVERKYFKCPRIVGDNIDLSTHQIYIAYVTAKDRNGSFDRSAVAMLYYCEDMTLDETGSYIKFSWKLSENVLDNPGFVAFAVSAKYMDGDALKTRWKTTPAVGTVLMTVPDNGKIIAELYPDIIAQLIVKMEAVEEIATPEAMQGYVNTYLAEHPAELDETLTDNTKAAPAGLVGELKGDLSQLSEEIANKTGTGLSTEAIDKLEEVGNYLAYTTADGGSKWTELISILRNGSSGGGSGENVPATGITLDKITLSFTDSTSQNLVATVEPSDTTDKVVWTSDAESVATVTNGVVKPLSNGSATITATCGSVSATCSVTVDIAGEEQVTLISISATYTGGDVAVGTSLGSLTGITVTGTYSDGSTANITGYTLSGTIAEGSNTITVSYGGKTTTFTVTGVAGGETSGDGTEWTDGVPYEYALVENEYVGANGFKPYNGWSRTPYLPCRGASSITLSFSDGSNQLPGGAYSVWYDSDKTMISEFNPSPSNFSNIPENACYLIISQDHTVMTNIASITPHA